MESLMKYMPFVDFLLKTDEKKYYKFTKIRKWILSKKLYSPAVVKKTEDAVLMQYKNLLLENKVKIPQVITDTFAPSIDLCSDDEEQVNTQNKVAGKVHKNFVTKQEKTSNLDVDDDLELVGIDYLETAGKQDEKTQQKKETGLCKKEVDFDETSKEILNKIDQIAADDKRQKGLLHAPVNYTFDIEIEHSDSSENDQEDIFQRRTVNSDTLFKRRTDFTPDEVIVESLNDKKMSLLSSEKPLETITLDSDSESEVFNDGEHRASPNAEILIENNVTENTATNSATPVSEMGNADANSNGRSGAIPNEKLEMLCDLIESVLPEMSDLLNEVEAVNVTTNPVVVEESDKENSMRKNTTGTSTIDPEQVSKILEDISCKIDFEMESFYEALQYVKRMNLDKGAIPDTPPPAPPCIPRSPAMVPPVQLSYEQQMPQMVHPMSACNAPNSNIVPAVLPPKPKLNINDPRIKKHLQVIKNSPLFSHKILNDDLERSINKICQETVMRPSTLNINQNNTGSSVSKSSATGTNKSSITYGEYKRRQTEKKLEMERKREEERNAKLKVQSDQKELEYFERSASREVQNIRSQLLSTLDPCKEKLFSLWKQQNDSNEKQQKETGENSKANNAGQLEINSEGGKNASETQQKEIVQTKQVNNAKELNVRAPSTSSNRQTKSKKSSEHKLNRIFNELKCTVKGFDQIQDYIVDEANFADNEMQSCANTSPTVEEPSTRLIGLRRRSSIHALSAITEQLGLQSDCSDSELSQNSSGRRANDLAHYSSSEGLSQDSLYYLPKRRKTIDEAIRPSQRTKVLRIVDDETSSSDIDAESCNNFRQRVVAKVPIIKLRRMSSEFIRKHTKRARNESTATPIENAVQSVKLRKTNEVVESLQEPCQKIPKLKKYNNDCQMTERNTSFCVLCRSKPTDLTNHYKGRHKIESYVSRLDWSDLEDLAVNTHFATLQPKTKNYRFDRYVVECPFCKEKIIDQFINLYNHYSVHTGEYAFQCSHCSLAKPYKPDIQSHILHSKTCRNSTIQVVYRYPPQAQCIYLHYCNICNFVQLNEANVLKHLREHHERSKAVESNVQKCILAAMSNACDAGHTKNSISPVLATEVKPSAKLLDTTQTRTPVASEIKFKIDDDDIPVSNEPCFEDEYTDVEGNTCEDMLRHMHEEPAQPIQPMTVIHNMGGTNVHGNNTPVTASLLNPQPAAVEYNQPFNIKSEALDKMKLTSATCFQPKQPAAGNVYMPYEKYRSYPSNANYLGLYKCMTDDCFYSTDCTSEIVTHLTEHPIDALNPNEYLQCPYCNFSSDTPITPAQLVEHVRTQHAGLIFQCSKCCYRSCDASNVHLHQQIHHIGDLNTCRIYKSSIGEPDSTENSNLDDKIEKNVFKISCKICRNASFYQTQLLINHFNNVHNLTSGNRLNIYSCIYCPFTVDNKNQLRFHIAAKHPEERPIIYDHNVQINNANEDIKSSSNIVDISEPVPYTEANVTTETASLTEENISQDIKPDFKALLSMNEEIVKVRLRKYTAHTGVAPDNLYRCPEQSCGGFFSNAELWVRHMKVRHLTLECQCPHCSTAMMLPLEQFATHFEQHRRHTYICFYCATTTPTESLARKHAAQKHSEFPQMRFEKIRFNISYSYWILIQKELFQEREKFIAEFLRVLDERLNELERNELKNLKQQWPIRENFSWFDDFLQNLPQRKVARRCLVKNCNFRTLKEEILYRHLSSSHTIAGTQFNCSKCSYHVDRCSSLDELFNHIKLHNDYHFICGACSLVTSSRVKVTAHIEEQHTARDVPVIHLFRINDQMCHKISIVFADGNITFSTMKNCFCCPEKSMSGDVFNLHLKRYHNLFLTHYCEKCTNFSFKSLQEVKPHFEQFHNSGKFKIRCELAAHSDLHVTSLNDFQVEISTSPLPVANQTLSSITVKNEPLDTSDNDNVILIEEDDVVIENTLKAAQHKQAELPKLKCVSFNKLLKPNINATPSCNQPQHAEMPRLQCAAFSRLLESNNNTMPIPAPTLQAHVVVPGMSAASTMPLPSVTSTQGYYNFAQRNLNNTNPLMHNINALTQVPAAPAQNSNNFAIINRTIIRPVAPNINSTLMQVRPLQLNANSLSSLNNNFRNILPNTSQYTVASPQTTSNNVRTIHPNIEQISNSMNSPYLATPQNYEYM